MPSLKTQVELLFGGRCKRSPQGVHFAPGRVTVLGDHLETLGGPVLAAPLAQGVACAWGIRPDSRVVVWSLNAKQKDSFHQGQGFKSGRIWSDLARGACAHVAKGGRRMPGVDLMVLGDLPTGQGLASSAAYLTVLLRSLNDAVDTYRSKWDLAEDIPHIEREWMGRSSSRLDPYIVAAARPGQVLRVNTQELDHVAWDLPEDYELAAEDSGVVAKPDDPRHELRALELAAALDEIRAHGPDVARLVDLTPESFAAVENLLGPATQRRARHVVTEVARVAAAVEAIEAGDMKALGLLMIESQRSLAGDFEGSSPEIDSLIDLAMSRDSIVGARLQGRAFAGRIAVLQRKMRDE